jgi:drug/metabolite transporter (DMT)-like permease
VVSVVLATLWLGERPGASLLVAVVMILGGVALGAGAARTSHAPVQ